MPSERALHRSGADFQGAPRIGLGDSAAFVVIRRWKRLILCDTALGVLTGPVAGGSELSPLNPGPGTEPPYLAGREPQKQAVQSSLQRLRKGERLSVFLVLLGPRGNGKTVMLGWIRREAEPRGIETHNLTAGGIGTEQKLVARIAPSRWWDRIRRVSAALLTVVADSRETPPIANPLRARLRRGPLVLLIDEAHVLNVTVGKVLLPEAQQLVNEGKPLLWCSPVRPDCRAV